MEPGQVNGMWKSGQRWLVLIPSRSGEFKDTIEMSRGWGQIDWTVVWYSITLNLSSNYGTIKVPEKAWKGWWNIREIKFKSKAEHEEQGRLQEGTGASNPINASRGGRKERLKEAQKRPTREWNEVIGLYCLVEMMEPVASVGNGVVDRPLSGLFVYNHTKISLYTRMIVIVSRSTM